MTLKDLKEYIQALRGRADMERKFRQARVEFHNKIAVPFSCLVFVLVGAPLGMQPQRSSSSIGIGLSIVCFFLYYVLWYYACLLGQSGQLPEALASWSGNLATGLVGIALVAKASR
jgi:lipopolysaccharide export system permease protein